MIMTTKLPPQEIDRIAAEWAARRCSGFSEEDQSALNCWLEADPRHLGAYAKAEAVLAQLDRARAAGPDALRIQETSSSNGSAIKRRTVLAGAAAAGLAIAGSSPWLTHLPAVAA